MSDVKVEIGTGQQFCGVRVLQDFHISHIPQEFARIYSYEDYLSDSGVAEPTAQPTSLVFSSVGENQMTLSWTAASPAVDGYIVLRSTTAISDVPVDLTNYNVGDTIGSSTVEFLGAGVTFVDSSLSAYTTYYYAVFSYNGASGTYNFLTTAPLTGNQITLYDFGNTLHFDMSNDSVYGSVNSYGDAYTTRTLGVWIKWDSKATTMHIVGRSSTAARGWGIQSNSSGKIVIPQSTNGTAGSGTSTMTITTGQWYYIGVLWNNAGATNADKLKLYVGTLGGALTQDTLTYSGTLATAFTSNLPMRFGALTLQSSFFDGYLDDAAMWSDNDLAHLTNHYNGGTGAPADATNRTMWLKFDESNPVTACTDETGLQTWTASNFNGDANSGSEAR